MPGAQRRQRKERPDCARHSNTTQRLKSITSNERVVPEIEKGRVARGMAWRSYDLQRSNVISLLDQARWLDLANEVTIAQLERRLAVIQAKVASQQTSLACSDYNLCVRQLLMKGIERACMIHMCVCQNNTHNG